MSPIALASILAIVAPLVYFTWALAGTDRSVRRTIEQNLGLGKAAAKHSTKTLPEALQEISRKIMPVGYAAWLDRKLAGIGRPRSWPIERILVIKPVLSLAGLAFGLLFYLRSPSPPLALLTIGLTALFYFLPDILLHNGAQKRREAMRIALPNMLDQMLISVEAGVGFEAAMSRAAESSTGPLADEFVRTLQDIQVGRSRREAYLDLGARTDFAELRSFIRAVVQADQYGIAIAKVLRGQAKEMRVKRRQRAEEHAMKIPVKILFPLIVAILPALFIVVLGPSVLNIMKLFS
ncbi:type II secretion system F family protein [Sinomonas flava]|uniref:Type II secretion system protein GspF domain-containing protein n=1 Tax=Sinomonas flava TaxID=496857 RepID=A0ABN3BPY4_9MICC